MEDPRTLLKSAEGMYRSGDVGGALNLCIPLLETYPTWIPLHNFVGVLLCETRNFQTAYNAFEHILSIDPSYHQAHDYLSFICLSLKNPKAAVQHGFRAISANPHNANTYNVIGIALMHVGDNEEALHYLRRSLSICPDAKVHSNLIFILDLMEPL